MMIQQLNLDQMGLTPVSFEDANMISGGDQYSSGYAVGQTVRKYLDDALLVAGIIALFA